MTNPFIYLATTTLHSFPLLLSSPLVFSSIHYHHPFPSYFFFLMFPHLHPLHLPIASLYLFKRRITLPSPPHPLLLILLKSRKSLVKSQTREKSLPHSRLEGSLVITRMSLHYITRDDYYYAVTAVLQFCKTAKYKHYFVSTF